MHKDFEIQLKEIVTDKEKFNKIKIIIDESIEKIVKKKIIKKKTINESEYISPSFADQIGICAFKKNNSCKEFKKEKEMIKNEKIEGKPDLSLIPMGVLEEDARAYEYGIIKYYRHSWMQGFKYSTSIASCLRHIKRYFWNRETCDNEAFDEGVQVHHLAMARFWLANIIYCDLRKEKREKFDDRPD